MKLFLATALLSITASAQAASIQCTLTSIAEAGRPSQAVNQVTSISENENDGQVSVTLDGVTLRGVAVRQDRGNGFRLWGVSGSFAGEMMNVVVRGQNPDGSALMVQYVSFSKTTGYCSVSN